MGSQQSQLSNYGHDMRTRATESTAKTAGFTFVLKPSNLMQSLRLRLMFGWQQQ